MLLGDPPGPRRAVEVSQLFWLTDSGGRVPASIGDECVHSLQGRAIFRDPKLVILPTLVGEPEGQHYAISSSASTSSRSVTAPSRTWRADDANRAALAGER